MVNKVGVFIRFFVCTSKYIRYFIINLKTRSSLFVPVREKETCSTIDITGTCTLSSWMFVYDVWTRLSRIVRAT